MTVLFRYFTALEASVGKSREDRNLVATADKLLAHIRRVKRLGPVVLADDEDSHLAPSPLIIVRMVRQIIPRSSLTQRLSM